MEEAMPRPEGWIGSDMRARTDVCQWLNDHGTEVHDPAGLLVGRMRTELGKGRALSQLLADMTRDGMIEREVRGRRTFMVKLVDDWGLLAEAGAKGYREVVQPNVPAEQQDAGEPEGIELGNVDLAMLAETLLALVVKRAQVQPSRGAEIEKLKEQVVKQKAEIAQLRDDLILARDSEAEQRRNADTMRESLAKLQRSMTQTKREGVPLKDHLSPAGKKLLTELAGSLPK